jgi:hypothetical protein
MTKATAVADLVNSKTNTLTANISIQRIVQKQPPANHRLR